MMRLLAACIAACVKAPYCRLHLTGHSDDQRRELNLSP